MLMKLPEGVSSISIGEAGQLKEVAPGVVEVPFEDFEQATRHGLTTSDFVPVSSEQGKEEEEDHSGKTKKELIALLEERKVEVPANATKDVLLKLVTESEKE